DGISAAVLVAELAAQTKHAGRTLLDLLDDLAVTHGLHATDQLSIRVQELAVIADAMRRLRRNPPPRLADSPVTGTHDFRSGSAGLPPTDALRFLTADDSRVIVRPSGTEPKLKCYLEVIIDVVDGDVAAAHSKAGNRLAGLRRDIAIALGHPGE
ncbi:MAG: phospho-sugar mutase, partial [Jiangellaceae bacterium]